MTPETRRRSIRWFLVGLMLAQAAWILAVPPFRGSDEFDHVYRAASAGRGYWWPSHSTGDGRGELLPVPPETVHDATPVCESYTYTGPANCRPAGAVPGTGLVEVASAASRYHPAYYAVVGGSTAWTTGAASVYAMRIVSALLCLGFCWLAAAAVASWARTRWPMVTLMAALTPVTVYSTTVVAPNGLELTAALAVWCTLLALTRDDPATARTRVLAGATLAAVVLATLRTLGPFWLLTNVVACAVAATWPPLRAVLTRHAGSMAAATAVVVTATLLSVGWILAVAPNELEVNENAIADPVVRSLGLLPTWFFQSIAAFPLRTEVAPPVVYGCATLVFLMLLVTGLVRATWQLRTVTVAVAAASLAVPFFFTALTYRTAGVIWQGRYTLPLAFGCILLAGVALDRVTPLRPGLVRLTRVRPILVAAGVICWYLAQTVSIVKVLLKEVRESPLSGDDRWLQPSPALLVALMSAAAICWLLSARSWGRRPEQTTAEEPTGVATLAARVGA